MGLAVPLPSASPPVSPAIACMACMLAGWATVIIAANDKMHAGMALDFTGDADVDFVRGMIAHHQGAVDMARVLLEHGTDPELKTLAETIISAQEEEIRFMQDWLARNGG